MQVDAVEFEDVCAQGDVMVIRIDELPNDLELTKVDPENGNHIVAHSETGHHHVVADAPGVELYRADNDNDYGLPRLFLVTPETDLEIRHLRDFDTHKTVKSKPGIFELRPQRTRGLEGWQKAQD